ncbi:MAG: hypothetical protein LBR35_02595 [Rickettsiales bacterium]|jgi:hypothetical protein|nr:hypothetical protein [Rickettsiales bacterium]
MKKVLFAFIFAILGIGVGTIFSKPISNFVDNIFGIPAKIEIPVTVEPVKQEMAIENPFQETPVATEPQETNNVEITNPFQDVVDIDDSVGIDIITGNKVYLDEGGYYIIDPETNEIFDIDEQDINFK